MITLFSPAKLNLSFRVLGKRSDGYHEIASLYQAIDLGDELSFVSHKERDILTSEGFSVPLCSSNLILKACELFRQKTGIPFYLKIHLKKNIPLQAGLGGGSSNAATTLWALCHLTQNKLSPQILREWGAELGSDVPFFFSQGTAYCTGRGERVEEREPVRLSDSLWLIKPPFGLSTADVYQQCSCDHFSSRNEEIYSNDLELPAFKLEPRLHELKEKALKQGFNSVCMTGSGTALMCMGDGDLSTLFSQLNYPLFSKKVSFLSRSSDEWYNTKRG